MPPLLADMSPNDPAVPSGSFICAALFLIIGVVRLGVWIANDPQNEPPGDDE